MTTALEPAWLRHARTLIGTREAAGAANSPTIMGWAKKLGMKVLGMVYNADSVPWCGLFVATCLAQDGVPAAPIAVRAKAWATWGANLAAAKLAPGAVLVFERAGGGHVGFYVGEDQACYHVLGGNQGDRVSIMRLEKSRCVARRWPLGRAVVGKPSFMKAIAGVPLSRDEA
ncbi:TIGR02594 family protein [Sphingomonas sp. R86521]|uniref:TIGR02594 family protein n=1 Tax=Sphingomonas sp. R86521 TaxID=3093860 RepID=UPI0036D2DA45